MNRRDAVERRDRVERYLLGVMSEEEVERLEDGLGTDDALLKELVETACENTPAARGAVYHAGIRLRLRCPGGNGV